MRRSSGIEVAGIIVLFEQHRQILRNRVPEVRTENADVITAAIAHANHSLRSGLVCNAQAWSEGAPIVIDAAAQAVRTDACNADSAGSKVYDVRESSVSFAVHGLGEVNLPAQTVIDGQLRSCAPGILSVKEEALLPLSCVVRTGDSGVVDVAGKRGHVAQEERGQVQAAIRAIGSGLGAEVVFTRPVVVAGDA